MATSKKLRCPCCGYYTLNDEPGNYDICPICYWEDDPMQRNNEFFEGGANSESLHYSKKYYRKFGACSEDLIKYVRKPTKDEIQYIMSKSEGREVLVKTCDEIIHGKVEVYENRYDNDDDLFEEASICVVSFDNTSLLYEGDIQDIQFFSGSVLDTEYRFAISSTGYIKIFDHNFQKEVFERYLEENGLDEEVVLEANQDWDAILDGLSDADREKEMPRKLPDKYKGDIFEELDKLLIDFQSMGVWSDMEIIFEDITGTKSYFLYDEEFLYTTLDILKSLGYSIETVEVEGESWSVVR